MTAHKRKKILVMMMMMMMNNSIQRDAWLMLADSAVLFADSLPE